MEKKAVPLVLFGDHAPFTKKDSITLILWKVLLSDGKTWETIFLSIAFPKDCSAKYKDHGVDTWAIFYKWLVSFFNHLLLGIQPSRNPLGKEWPLNSWERKVAGEK